jgi:hypothetical protein
MVAASGSPQKFVDANRKHREIGASAVGAPSAQQARHTHTSGDPVRRIPNAKEIPDACQHVLIAVVLMRRVVYGSH